MSLSRNCPLAMLPVVSKDLDPLAELDRRHDEALRQLEELEDRVERAICEFATVQQAAAERFGRKQKAA